MPKPPLSLLEVHEVLAECWGRLAASRCENQRDENLRLTAETTIGKLMMVAVLFQSRDDDQDRNSTS